MTDDQGTNSPENGPGSPQEGQNGGSGGPDAPQGQKPGKSASGDSGNATDSAPQTYPAAVVKELREEVARYRTRSKRVDALATKLVHSMAAQTGRLADPTDLPFTPELLDDDGMPDDAKVQAALDDLLQRKPHLASRKPSGDVGQGITNGQSSSDFSLAKMLRAGAG